MMERTFALIKPGAVKEGLTGAILTRIEQEGFSIVRLEKRTLSREFAAIFYGVHKERSFFGELIDSVTSGPVVVMMLEKENAIKAWRDLMGSTNPAQAAENTLRKLYGRSIGENATHGSDAPETAATELALYFSK